MFKKEDYLHLKDQIIKRVKDKGVESITEYAALTGIPLVPQYEIIAEEMPEHREFCEKKVKELKEFFDI